MEGRGQIDGDYLIPFISRKVFDRTCVLNACVVDEDVDTLKLRTKLLVQFLDFGSLAKIRPVIIGFDPKFGFDGLTNFVNLGCFSEAVETMFAFCAANFLAIPKPIPLVDPVTSAVFPLSIIDSCTLSPQLLVVYFECHSYVSSIAFDFKLELRN